jgi:hypothetical protein
MLPKVILSYVLPFESLMLEFYFQMQFSLMNQLHEHEFILLLANAPLYVLQAHFCSCACIVVWAWLLAHPSTLSFHLSSAHFLTTFHIPFSISHLTFHIFHNVNVVILSMIWVSICYIVHVRMSALHPMIHFEIPL